VTTRGGAIEIDAQLVFSSVGWRAAAFDDIPYDAGNGAHSNVAGRVTTENDIIPGLYVAGWGKRGATGVIGTNRACGVETARAVLEDLPVLSQRPLDADGNWRSMLRDPSIQIVDFEAWKRLDMLEMQLGQQMGRPRQKITNTSALLIAAIGQDGTDQTTGRPHSITQKEENI
jgi:ferredoxin--NADP+ reductase